MDGKVSVDFFIQLLLRHLHYDECYMDSLAIAYAKNNMVYFASITVDPKRDSIKALQAYSSNIVYLHPSGCF